MRRQIVAGNWKMNLTLDEATHLIDAIASASLPPDSKIMVIPPFTHLALATHRLAGTAISVGAQTVSPHDNGAYTGDISAAMLAEIGCQHVLVGHSERRQYHHEDNDLLNRQLKQALSHGLSPIYCIGETVAQREANETLSIISTQLIQGLADITSDGPPLIIAYEPVWAIGTGKVATPEQAEEAHAHIRQQLSTLWDADAANQCPILYGGSVNADNSAAIFAQANIDGGLIGGASLKSDAFLSIAQSFEE